MRQQLSLKTLQIKPIAISHQSQSIDFLRWFCAFLVLIYHIRANVLSNVQVYPESSYYFLKAALLLLTNAGDQAVYCFFVISGFLVGGAVFERISSNEFSLWDYAVSRFSRIYIVLVPALILGGSLDWLRISHFGISSPPSAGGETLQSLSPATLLVNLLNLQNIISTTFGSSNALWSLCNEWWYYVMFPLFLSPLMRNKTMPARVVMFTVASVIAIFIYLYNPSIMLMFGFWLVGACARLVPRPAIRNHFVAYAVLFAAIFLFPIYKPRVHLPAIYLSLAAANFLIVESRRTQASQRLSALVNKRLAEFSYTQYLIHGAMLHFILCFWFNVNNPRIDLAISSYSLSVMVALAAILMLYSAFFGILIETKTDRLRRSIKDIGRRLSARVERVEL